MRKKLVKTTPKRTNLNSVIFIGKIINWTNFIKWVTFYNRTLIITTLKTLNLLKDNKKINDFSITIINIPNILSMHNNIYKILIQKNLYPQFIKTVNKINLYIKKSTSKLISTIISINTKPINKIIHLLIINTHQPITTKLTPFLISKIYHTFLKKKSHKILSKNTYSHPRNKTLSIPIISTLINNQSLILNNFISNILKI